jgi:hypothetical protein
VEALMNGNDEMSCMWCGESIENIAHPARTAETAELICEECLVAHNIRIDREDDYQPPQR